MGFLLLLRGRFQPSQGETLYTLPEARPMVKLQPHYILNCFAQVLSFLASQFSDRFSMRFESHFLPKAP
jgi:hypothetical protein